MNNNNNWRDKLNCVCVEGVSVLPGKNFCIGICRTDTLDYLKAAGKQILAGFTEKRIKKHLSQLQEIMWIWLQEEFACKKESLILIFLFLPCAYGQITTSISHFYIYLYLTLTWNQFATPAILQCIFLLLLWKKRQFCPSSLKANVS